MSKHLLGALIVLGATFVMSTATVSAAPAYPVDRELRQPDGSTVTLRPWGDDSTGGWETRDGFRVERDEPTGRWDFAILDPLTGKLKASGIQVDKGTPPAPPRLLPTTPKRPRLGSQGTGSVFGGIGSIGIVPVSTGSGTAAWAGTNAQLPFIMVAFSDVSCSFTASQMQNNLFGNGATGPGNLNDYFREVSNGKFDPHGNVYGCFTLSRSKAYYDTTTDGEIKLVEEAVKLADPTVNFANFDKDGDGEVDALGIIYAGGSANDGCYAGSSVGNIWPHEWNTDGTSTSDGVKVNTYVMVSELTDDASSGGACNKIQTIGIFAHELGHTLGLPDLYDTDSSNATSGVGAWSTMSYQYLSTVNLADTPPHYDPWSKSFLGWLVPSDVTNKNTGVELPAAAMRPYAARLLSNPNGVEIGGSGEYFLVENRQRIGFDASLPGCGVVIWHVDESRTANNREGTSLSSHRLIDVAEADGNPQDLDGAFSSTNVGDTGDPFPGSSNNRLFTDTSAPSAQLYGGASSGVRVRVASRDACSTSMLTAFGNPTQLTFELRGLPASIFGVSVVDETTGVTTTLRRDADQVYRGVELIDTAVVGSSIRYHFEDTLGIEPLRRVSTVDFARTISTAEVSARAATISTTVEAESIGINGPTTVVPGTTVSFAARYADSFGAIAIEDPQVSFTASKSGQWIGTVHYDTSANQVCLRSPATDPLVVTLPSCAAYGAATTLSGPYVRVDVARTTKSPVTSDIWMSWAVSFTDGAASRAYVVQSHARDRSGVNLAWQDTTFNIGVSHRPTVGTLSPRNAAIEPLVATPFVASFSDPDGAGDLGTVSLGIGSRVLATYDRPSNTLNVRDVSRGVSAAGCLPGAAQELSVGVAVLDCARSTIASAGNILTVTWNLELADSLALGSFTESLQAKDAFGNDTGVVSTGTLAVDHAPKLIDVSPKSGAQIAGSSQVFTLRASDEDGLSDLTRLELSLQSTGLLVQKGVTVAYSSPTNTLTLSTGKEIASCTPGATQVISVSLASLDCAASRVSTSTFATSNGLVFERSVSWSLKPTASMGGSSYAVVGRAVDASGLDAGPTKLGSWDVR